MGGKVGLTILCSRARKARLDYVPYSGKYSVETFSKLIPKAYKQFSWLKSNNTRHDTWIAQLISAQAMAWNQIKKLFGSNYDVPNEYT